MPIFESPLGPVAYDDRGDGHPLVLLPSGAHDRHDFDELRGLLPGRFRTIVLDWPGHGESPAGEGPASAMSFADLAERFVEHVAPGGAVVVGNSVGGFAAGRLAVRRPELVKGLVIADGGGFGGRPPYVRAFCALMARPGFLRRIYPAFSARYMRARTDADRRARDVGVATTRADPGLRVVSELWRSFSSPEHDLRAEAPSITAPTLLIWGRRDPVIPPRLGKRAAALIPGSELVILDTGHAPHVSDPEGFGALLVPFADAAFAAPPRPGGVIRGSAGRMLGPTA
jgi:pimeloyl-ACP methyl ester carboxylesterase